MASLVEHGILNVRTGTQPLGPDMFRRVCELLGPIKSLVAPARDGTSAVRYDTDMQTINAGKVYQENDGERRVGSWEYHTDDSYTAMPGRFTCLHPLKLPPSGGGDTGFISMTEARNSLPEYLRRDVSGKDGIHHFNNEGLFTDIKPGHDQHPGNDLEDAVHPLVRLVPETGKAALYINLNRMKGVLNCSDSESVQLLQSLQFHARQSTTEHSSPVAARGRTGVGQRSGGAQSTQ
jgi:alpha-ketoglutarate-dependent taurine dioxygenase